MEVHQKEQRRKREGKEEGDNLEVAEGLLNGGGTRANDLLDALAVLVEDEGGHGADVLVGGGLLELIDVDLDEGDVGELGAVSLNGGGDRLARAAPLSEKVDEDLSGGNELGVLGVGGDVGDGHFVCCFVVLCCVVCCRTRERKSV